MELTQKKSSWFAKLNARLKKTGDSEPEQAKLRLAIGIFLVLYFCLPWAENETFARIIVSVPSLITITYYSFALLIFLSIVRHPVASPIRRICGAVLDMVSLSIVMYHSGGDSVPLFVLYLWVILGNGFRFGIMYLYISQSIGIVGFSLAAYSGIYWIENKSFAFANWAMSRIKKGI